MLVNSLLKIWIFHIRLIENWLIDRNFFDKNLFNKSYLWNYRERKEGVQEREMIDGKSNEDKYYIFCVYYDVFVF